MKKVFFLGLAPFLLGSIFMSSCRGDEPATAARNRSGDAANGGRGNTALSDGGDGTRATDSGKVSGLGGRSGLSFGDSGRTPGSSAGAGAGAGAGSPPPGNVPAGSANQTVFYIGHSLINRRMPAMVKGLADDDDGVSIDYASSILNGASLADQWHDSADTTKTAVNFKTEFFAKKYDAVIITERVPVGINSAAWGGVCFGAQIYNLAYQANNAVKFYVYETWNKNYNPTGVYPEPPNVPVWEEWRSQIDVDYEVWKKFASDIQSATYEPWLADKPSQAGREPCLRLAQVPNWNPIEIIPGGQAMARLYDTLKTGPVGSVTQIEDVFSDWIHLNDTGNYYIAAVVFAKIYGVNPGGLGTSFSSLDLNGYQAPNAATAAALQKLAWDVVTSSN